MQEQLDLPPYDLQYILLRPYKIRVRLSPPCHRRPHPERLFKRVQVNHGSAAVKWLSGILINASKVRFVEV